MSNSALMTSPSLAIPGTANMGSVTGYVPLYTPTLGVFNVIGTPTVDGTYAYYNHGPPSGMITYYPLNFFLDPDSYEVVFNPAIIHSGPGGASIENYKEEIIVWDTLALNSQIYDGFPTEQLQGETVYVLDPTDEIPQPYRGFMDDMYESTLANYYLRTNKRMTNEVLRITFDVVPSDGAPRVKVVKSFYLYCNPTLI
jgi:hypothetical protein